MCMHECGRAAGQGRQALAISDSQCLIPVPQRLLPVKEQKLKRSLPKQEKLRDSSSLPHPIMEAGKGGQICEGKRDTKTQRKETRQVRNSSPDSLLQTE